VAGRPTAILKLAHKAVERHALMYPMHAIPGIDRGPRPPFAYVPVSEVRLASKSRNLLLLAQLVGTSTPVKFTGTYGYFNLRNSTAEDRGLTVASATVRNTAIPAELPSATRLLTLAKVAVLQQLQRRPAIIVEGQPQAYNQGGLLVKVLVRTRDRVSGRASHVAYRYDFVTGAVRVAPIAVAQAR
jgi:hypothetical protein